MRSQRMCLVFVPISCCRQTGRRKATVNCQWQVVLAIATAVALLQCLTTASADRNAPPAAPEAAIRVLVRHGVNRGMNMYGRPAGKNGYSGGMVREKHADGKGTGWSATVDRPVAYDVGRDAVGSKTGCGGAWQQVASLQRLVARQWRVISDLRMGQCGRGGEGRTADAALADYSRAAPLAAPAEALNATTKTADTVATDALFEIGAGLVPASTGMGSPEAEGDTHRFHLDKHSQRYSKDRWLRQVEMMRARKKRATEATREGMMHLRERLGLGPTGASPLWATEDPCNDKWKGLTCVNGTVEKLDLGSLFQTTMVIPDDAFAHEGLWTMRVLDISGLGLRRLPSTLAMLRSLTKLHAYDNPLGPTLPGIVTDMLSLEVLDVRHTNLKSLSPGLNKLQSLKELRVESNELTQLPDMDAIRSLRVLRAYNNKLTRLPVLGEGLEILDVGDNKMSFLPESFGDRMTSLQYLVLDKNGLTSLPQSVGRMGELRVLKLKHNKLTALPDTIGNLAQLRILNICFNRLKELPHSMERLSSLQALEAGHNDLTSLPFLVGLSRLRFLDVNNNQIAVLPDSIGGMGKLRMLIIEENLLTTLPDNLHGLKSLHVFRARKNRLVSLPPSIFQMKAMRTLSLTGNRLTRLPEPPAEVNSVLNHLFLASNQLTHLPNGIGVFKGVTVLTAFENKLTALPDSIGNMTALTNVRLQINRLSHLPATINRLMNLIELTVHSNLLKSIPSLTGMASLSNLDVADNQLVSLPPSVGDLPNLNILDVGRNRLKIFPSSIGRLKALQIINAVNNELASLPDEISDCEGLTYFTVNGNTLTRLPENIGKLQNLLGIDASRNMITRLPDSIRNLRSVQDVNVNSNRLTSIPASMARQPSLLRLDLSNNFLSQLPSGPWNMPNLEYFDVSHNKLAGPLPDDIFRSMEALTVLDVSNNQLEMLPDSIVMLKQLSALELFNNKIRSLPGSFWTFVSSLPQISLAMENNLIRHSIGRFEQAVLTKGTSEVYIDDSAFAPSVGIDGCVKSMLGLPEAAGLKWMMSTEETSNTATMSCRIKTAKEGSKAVHIRTCGCAKGFYSVAAGHELRCLACPPNGLCLGGMLMCHDKYYMRWTPAESAEFSGASCVDCPAGATCSDNIVTPEPGSWWDVSYTFPNSSDAIRGDEPAVYQHGMGEDAVTKSFVFECRNREACQGGSNSTCAVGYEGRLCATCSKNYYSSGHNRCIQCPNGTAGALMLLFGLISAGVIVSVLFFKASTVPVLQKSIRDPASSDWNAIDATVPTDSATAVDSDGVLTVSKIFIAFVQILTGLDLVFDVDWPDVLHVFDDIFGWVNLDWVRSSSLECMWEKVYAAWGGSDAGGMIPQVSYGYNENMCIIVSIPLLTSAFLFSLRAVLKLSLKWHPGFARASWVENAETRCVQTHMLLWSFAYLPVSSRAMGYFLCDTFDGGKTHWVHDDLAVQCYTESYYWFRAVAIFALVVYTFGFPLFVFGSSMMLGAHKKLEATTGSKSLRGLREQWAVWIGVLARTYRDGYEYWEAVEMSRKVLIGAAAMHLGSTATYQLTVALAIAFFAAILHFYCAPFRTKLGNQLAGMNLILVYLTMSIGLLSRLDVSSSRRELFAALVLGLDGIFVVLLLGIIVVSMWGEAGRGAVRILGQLRRRHHRGLARA